MGKKSKIIIQNRKMFCLNPECKHTTFAETFDFIKPKAKKSNRLLDKIIDVSLNVSSVNASDILKNGIAEGSVNKLKVIKRIMYGRCSFELLKGKLLRLELKRKIN